jgi:hypothetical protein
VKRQIGGYLALLAPGKYQIQIFVLADRPMRIVSFAWHFGEQCVVIRNVCGHKRISSVDGADPLQPEFFDQPILHRQMCPLDTSFGRRRVRADALDVEFVEHAPELRVPGATRCGREIYAEDAGFVTVERQRLAMSLDILARRLEVTERRLGAGEQDMHQSAGGIVDIHQCGTSRRPILEPMMLAAIDLDELAEACTSLSRLLDLRRPQFPWDPKSYGNL